MVTVKRHKKASNHDTTPKKAVRARGKDDFKSVAKRLECDENKAAFEKKLGKIAKVKPKFSRADQ